jgi:hypothetical protein
MISNLSPHIFWDVDVYSIDIEKNGVFVLQRVLQYGLLKDWLLIKSNLGIDKLRTYAIQIPTLDDVSISFLSNLLHIEKTEFKCYKNKQLNQNYWKSKINVF